MTLRPGRQNLRIDGWSTCHVFNRAHKLDCTDVTAKRDSAKEWPDRYARLPLPDAQSVGLSERTTPESLIDVPTA